MAHASRRLKHTRRIKRENTLLKRAGHKRAADTERLVVALYALLAEQGGEATVKVSTFGTVVANLPKLEFQLANKPRTDGTTEDVATLRLITH